MRQAVDEVEIDRAVPQFAHPVHRLLGHRARLDAMDRLLHPWIEILHAHRGAVETDFAQRHQVVPRQPSRIHFHTGFEVVRKCEPAPDQPAQPPDLVRP